MSSNDCPWILCTVPSTAAIELCLHEDRASIFFWTHRRRDTVGVYQFRMNRVLEYLEGEPHVYAMATGAVLGAELGK